MQISNLFTCNDDPVPDELIEILLAGSGFRLERIVSTGQSTPKGQWYDQEDAEWVILLKGGAGLRFDEPAETVELRPGDYLNIPAHRRHRVEWTDPQQESVWLALHYVPADNGSRPNAAES